MGPRTTAALLALLVPLVLGADAFAWNGGPSTGDDPDGAARLERLRPGPRRPAPRSVALGFAGAGACAAPSQSFLETGELPEGDAPSGVAFTVDGAQIVVAHRDSRNLVVLDAATRAVVRTIPLSGSPNALAVSSDGVHAVTANLFEDSASIVDLSTGAEVAVVGVGVLPGVVRVTPDGSTAVVGNVGSQELSVVDIASATEQQRIAGAGFTPTVSFAFEPGAYTWVPTRFECVDDATIVHVDVLNDEIDFFDLAGGTVSSIACDDRPSGIAITPGGGTALVTHRGDVRRISVVDTAARAITKTIATPFDLFGPVAIDPAAAKAVVHGLNVTRVVDLASETFSPALQTGSLDDLITTADGLYALGVGFRGPLVSYASGSIVAELNDVVGTSLGAVSPSGPRGVLVANTFGEDLLVVDTSGAAGSLEGRTSSGPPPEADRTRMLAISPDGTRAVTTNVLSDSASILDLETGAVEAVLAVGDRPADVEITPDGTLAVVANLDSSFASVIDLDARSVTNVPISLRGAEVEIAPDGRYAYVSVVSGGDGVWRIDLATLSTAGPKRPTGDMGSVSYSFSQASGLSLSHDGRTLVACGSFNDRITIIDTTSWTVAANVPVDAFPTRAAFSADDGTIYVANRDAGSVSIVTNAGGASALVGTVPVGEWPFEMDLSADGGTLYVLNYLSESVGVIDLASGSMTTALPVAGNPMGLFVSPTGACLHVASGTLSLTFGSDFIDIHLAGAFTTFDTGTLAPVHALDTGLPAAMLVADAAGTRAAVASPFGDGVTVVDLDDVLGTRYCSPAVPNSTGSGGRMTLTGSAVVADDDLTLIATGLPADPNIGYFVMGTGTGSFVPPGSSGPICIGPDLDRFLTPANNTSSLPGGFSRNVGTRGPISGSITAGSTWNFQAWHRDGMSPSNLTDAVSVTFQ